MTQCRCSAAASYIAVSLIVKPCGAPSYTSEVYEGAAHGYTMTDTAAYDAAAEQRHWTNLFALLDRALPVS